MCVCACLCQFWHQLSVPSCKKKKCTAKPESYSFFENSLHLSSSLSSERKTISFPTGYLTLTSLSTISWSANTNVAVALINTRSSISTRVRRTVSTLLKSKVNRRGKRTLFNAGGQTGNGCCRCLCWVSGEIQKDVCTVWNHELASIVNLVFFCYLFILLSLLVKPISLTLFPSLVWFLYAIDKNGWFIKWADDVKNCQLSRIKSATFSLRKRCSEHLYHGSPHADRDPMDKMSSSLPKMACS